MNPRSPFVVVAVASLLLAGCGKLNDGGGGTSSPVGESGDSTPPPGDVPPPNWQNPIGGVEVASISKAAQAVDFQPYVPKGLGPPARVLVDSGIGVALVYDTQEFGGVVILQQPQPLPTAEYEEWMQTVVDNVKLGSAEIVSTRGTEALVIVPETPGHGASISWLSEGREIIIRGPKLQRSDVLQLAEVI